MKNTLKLFCLIAFTLFILSSCTKNSSDSDKNFTQTTAAESIIEQTQQQSTSIVSVQPVQSTVMKEPIINKILGSSNKMSPSELAAHLKWREDIFKAASSNPGTVILNGQTSEKLVCLTFDDGPDAVITPRILDILKKYDVKACFFFIGSRLDNYSSIVKRAYSEGHTVLSHSWSHPDFSKLSPEQIRTEIKRTEDKLCELIGKRPAVIRPPYGSINQETINIFKADNYKALIWSIDTLDWSQREKDNIVKNVVENVRPGDIILMHSNEDKSIAADALPDIIVELTGKGYKFADMGQILEIDPYK